MFWQKPQVTIVAKIIKKDYRKVLKKFILHVASLHACIGSVMELLSSLVGF
jgi:hypothetical protein